MQGSNKHHHSFLECNKTEHGENLSELLDRCGHYYAHIIKGSRRGQDNVLLCLAQYSDMTQKELVDKLRITPASLSEVLMKLERKGYVVREKDENDRRLVRVQVTEAGREALAASVSEVDDPFKVLSPEEQRILSQTLSKLLSNWEKHYTIERRNPGRRHHGHGHSAHRENCFEVPLRPESESKDHFEQEEIHVF